MKKFAMSLPVSLCLTQLTMIWCAIGEISCSSASRLDQDWIDSRRARWVGEGFFSQDVERDTSWLPSMRREAVRWLGTPYLWGGEGPDSIDCSAYVRAVVRSSVQLELPRKAEWQSYVGAPVAKEAIAPGDLLFFGTTIGQVEHVGIYWGAGWFINATVSRGVAFSHLEESFWSGRFLRARSLHVPPRKE